MWIRAILYGEATGKLKTLYDRVKGPGNNVDNIMIAHSLRPHTMDGHMALYKNVLHHSANKMPRWFMECLGMYVSMLNSCDYCFEHHYEGMRRLLSADDRGPSIRAALENNNLEGTFDAKEKSMLRYAEKLTLSPGAMNEDDILALREVGYDDGEVLEANQVVSYFAYANRTVLGLGVSTHGDILGLSPSSEDPDDWSHTRAKPGYS